MSVAVEETLLSFSRELEQSSIAPQCLKITEKVSLLSLLLIRGAGNNVKLSADWSRNKEIGPRLIEQGTNKIFIIPSEARVITKFYWSRVRSEGDQFLYFETRRPIITLLLSLLVEQTRVFP